MHCCSECFKDPEIKAIISGNNKNRSHRHNKPCEYCGSYDGILYDIDLDSRLEELFNDLISVYTPISEISNDSHKDCADLLKNKLKNDWDIFNIESDRIYKLITSLCSNLYSQRPELFDSPVIIKESFDTPYLEKHSMLKTFHWDDFSKGIKTQNRFHSDFINKDILSEYLKSAVRVHKKGEVFFRSRICQDKNGFKPKEMGAPKFPKAGRVNPEGIPILYLSDSEETTLHEVRAGLYDYVSVGRFILQADIEVIDLTKIESNSPFIFNDLTKYAINIEHIKKMNAEIAQPLRNDNTLDYLPTQYISDFIRSLNYKGIQYRSTMNNGGINLAIFDKSLFRCKKSYIYDIQSIKYDYLKLQ